MCKKRKILSAEKNIYFALIGVIRTKCRVIGKICPHMNRASSGLRTRSIKFIGGKQNEKTNTNSRKNAVE